jgi:hypothetical protein
LTAVQNDQGVTTDVWEVLSAGLRMRATELTSIAPIVEQEPEFIPKRPPLQLEDLFDDPSSENLRTQKPLQLNSNKQVK